MNLIRIYLRSRIARTNARTEYIKAKARHINHQVDREIWGYSYEATKSEEQTNELAKKHNKFWNTVNAS